MKWKRREIKLNDAGEYEVEVPDVIQEGTSVIPSVIDGHWETTAFNLPQAVEWPLEIKLDYSAPIPKVIEIPQPPDFPQITGFKTPKTWHEEFLKSDSRQKIEQAAYFIWVNKGKPEGQTLDCWLEAEKQWQ